jgi:hypothetical protein
MSDDRKKDTTDGASEPSDELPKADADADPRGELPPPAETAIETAPAASVPESGDRPGPSDTDGAEPEQAPRAEGDGRSGDAEKSAQEAAPAEAAPVAPAPAPRRSDWFGRLLALVAIAGVVVVYGLSQMPQVSGGSAAKLAALERKVDAGGATAPVVDLSPLEQRIAQLGERIDAQAARDDELAALQEQMAEYIPDPAPDLSDELAAIEGRITALEERPEPAPAPQMTTTIESGAAEEDRELMIGLRDRLDALSDRVATVEAEQVDLSGEVDSRVSTLRAELTARIDGGMQDVQQRLEALSAAADAAGDARQSELARSAALLLGVGRLRDQAAGSAPFGGAWDAVVSLGVDPAGHAAIAAAAADGVATVAELEARLPDAANRAIVADQVGGDETWVGGALQRVGSLVKVRRTGEREGDDVEAVVARAEARLADGDLAAAVAELGSLEGPAADELAVWLADAQARLALDAAVDELQAAVLASLSRDG